MITDYFKSYLLYTLHSLTKYDLFAIGWVIFLALLLFTLALFIKRQGVRYTIIFFALFLMIGGPITLKTLLDGYLRKAVVTVDQSTPLTYSHALIVTGKITNQSRAPFTTCDLVLLFTKNHNDQTLPLPIPFTLSSFYIWSMNEPLTPNQTKHYKIIVDSFEMKDFHLTVQPRCYP